MFKPTISIIALMMLFLFLGSSQAQSQVAENKDSKSTILPGPPMNLPLPVAPPPSQGNTGYYGFFFNVDTTAATFTVKDNLGRELLIKDINNQYLPQQPGSGYIYEINVAVIETKVFLIGLKQYVPGAPPLDLIITGNFGEYYLLKIQN